MRYRFDHDYHIHSELSSCSRDPEQNPLRILQYARDFGLNKICITDHYWDSTVPGASKWYMPQNFAHIEGSRPLPQAQGIEFLFGCETDMDRFGTVGVPPARFDDFAFMIIPTTHLHMKGFTITEEDFPSVEAKARLWVTRMEQLLSQKLPFYKIGIAHLACPLLHKTPREEYLRLLDLIPEEDMVRVFTRAASVGVGIELNSFDMRFNDDEADTVLRMFRIAKQCGCKFYCGSDAHQPADLDAAKEIFEHTIDYLELTEEDKFHIFAK